MESQTNVTGNITNVSGNQHSTGRDVYNITGNAEFNIHVHQGAKPALADVDGRYQSGVNILPFFCDKYWSKILSLWERF